MKVADVVKAARAQVNGSAADESNARRKQVDQALGGNGEGGAPAFNKGLASYVAKSAPLFGRKGLLEVMGCGRDPEEGRVDRSNVIESVNFGCKKTNRHVDPEIKHTLLELKKDLHNCFLQQQMIAHQTKMPVAITDTPYFKAVVAPKMKAFNVTDFATWIPTLNTRFYFEEYELEPAIDKYFETVPMMSRTENVPGAINRLKGKLQADSDTFTAQYNTAANYTYTAQDCVSHTDITEDLMQDMVPQAGSFDRLRKEVMLGNQRSKEDAILNGDDTITSSVQGDGHMDSDVAGGAATLFNKAFKGLRKRALAASATYNGSGAGIDKEVIKQLSLVFGKFFKDKADLLLVFGPSHSNAIVTGAIPELLTLQNFGPQATIITGNMPKIYGVECYESEWVREDLGAAGVYASTSALTTALLVKKSRFVIGQRAATRIWATPSLANQDKMLLSAKERFTFGGVPQSATEKSVALAYNLSLS